ncbi:hypothetical protein [Lyngbya sp. CCY1209]|jgi:hypothetical protein|uniref:hypothetical protein n=1 Tax=Lyngbya sp. CCY1209 TaxID=2886103 RepID=UPI002D1FE99B|nr:hypothetical protein [Lyngbya sp. CCY1209]MEB3885573.1 hypothetical protein [Lyngbya sp. CCY1209]
MGCRISGDRDRAKHLPALGLSLYDADSGGVGTAELDRAIDETLKDRLGLAG